MDAPLIVAGSLGLIGAAIHGGAGEVFVVRELSPERLPATRFGGPRVTRAMIHASWHLATIAFLSVAAGLLLAGTVLDGDGARGVARLAAAASTGFAAVTVGLPVVAQGPRGLRSLYSHPGPPLLTATAVLAWWGAL